MRSHVTDPDSKAAHLQNRVTPFGDIVAIPQRGMFTGNPGLIHDPRTKSLLTKRWTNNAWLIRSCEYEGRSGPLPAMTSWPRSRGSSQKRRSAAW